MPSKNQQENKTEAKISAEKDRLAAARAKNLDLAISQIQKDYGDGAIMRLGEHTRVDVDVIPTGNLLIDRALGVGGFPRGRIIEVYGPESSGKTTLTLTAIAQAQKAGGLAAFVEHTANWTNNPLCYNCINDQQIDEVGHERQNAVSPLADTDLAVDA